MLGHPVAERRHVGHSLAQGVAERVENRRPEWLQCRQSVVFDQLPRLGEVRGFLPDPEDRVIGRLHIRDQIIKGQRAVLHSADKLVRCLGPEHARRQVDRAGDITSVDQVLDLAGDPAERLLRLLAVLRQVDKTLTHRRERGLRFQAGLVELAGEACGLLESKPKVLHGGRIILNRRREVIHRNPGRLRHPEQSVHPADHVVTSDLERRERGRCLVDIHVLPEDAASLQVLRCDGLQRVARQTEARVQIRDHRANLRELGGHRLADVRRDLD